jgi:hypothetical protein
MEREEKGLALMIISVPCLNYDWQEFVENKIVYFTIDSKIHYYSTEPTGIEYSIANFIPLPNPHFNPLSKASTCPLTK